MSSSSSNNTPAPLPAHRLVRLSSILRAANARYARVAASVRASLAPTHHARARAQKLGLALDIKKAVNCPERQVSVIPLPILDTAPSPAPVQRTRRARPALTLVVPRAAPAADVPHSCTSGPFSAVSLSSGPAAAAAAPTVLRGQHVPWLGPTSRFSVTPSDPIFTLAPNDPIFTLAPRRAPEPPVVPDVPFDEDDAAWELGYPEFTAVDYGSSALSSSSTGSSVSPSSSACPASSASTSGSSSNASSRGPSTPADTDPGVTLSAKRKSEDEDVVEKRPKYERKSWVTGSRRAPRKLF